jgi:hypothetical protein|tara:strand:- start:467 stop:652 length:186 start_codon:yes stop_codon:yes gene_type:complete
MFQREPKARDDHPKASGAPDDIHYIIGISCGEDAKRHLVRGTAQNLLPTQEGAGWAKTAGF